MVEKCGRAEEKRRGEERRQNRSVAVEGRELDVAAEESRKRKREKNRVDSDKKMKTYYQITAEEIGIVLLRKRKIAKALRRWLRERGHSYEYIFYLR